jgi:hypothetical protein
MGVVIGLVRARLSRRRSAAALLATAVGGCVLVLGSLLGVGVVTADQATRRTLADLPAPDRVIGVHRSSEDPAEGDAVDQRVREAMGPVLPLTEPLVAMTLYRPPRAPYRVIAIDDAARWLVVSTGRLPNPCTPGTTCEAVRISATALGNGVGEIGSIAPLGDERFRIVGTAVAIPDLPIEVPETDGLVLMAVGVDVLRHEPALATVPRTGFWVAPLDPLKTHSWQLDDLGSRVDTVRRSLAIGGPFLIDAPDDTLDAVRGRAAVAIGRLVFISSLVIGVLLAFAVFAAAVERPDVGEEYRRLRVYGAGPGELLAFVALEALIPAVAGSIGGVLGATATVAWIAANQSEPVADVIRLALGQPGALAIIVAISALAAVAVAVGIHPSSGRFIQPRIVATVALPVVLVMAWDRLTRGPVGREELGSAAAAPGTVLLPGLLGLTVILGSLVIVPPLLRRLARGARRAPLAIRMATISIARDPLRPAATLTLLAFSLGSAVLGVAYAETLRAGAADQAAFQTGLDIRVLSYAPDGRFATDVLPALASGTLGDDVEVHPLVRLDGTSATGKSFALTGIEPDVLPQLRRWRPDFSSTSITDIAHAMAETGAWVLPGHPLADGSRELVVDVDYTGDPIDLKGIVERADGTFEYLDLGDLAGGPQGFRVPIAPPVELAAMRPGEPAGWQLVGILAGNGGPTAFGGPEPGARQEGDIRVLGLPEIADPATPIHLDVSGIKSRTLIRAAARTDGLVLPALVSPELAADVDGNGELAVTMASGLELRLRPVATAARFPTVTDPGNGFVVIDKAPLLLAMTARDPGTGAPNQVLIATPNDARTATVVRTLGGDPFPALVVQSRPAIEAAQATDPFAIGVVWALAVGALAGIILSLAGVLMGAAAELRQDGGELREIEELGGGPRSLRLLVILRTLLLCLLGAITGVVVGLGLGWVAAATISVTGDGSTPIPPLVLVVPWLAIIILSLSVLVAVGVGVALLARRRFPLHPARTPRP